MRHNSRLQLLALGLAVACCLTVGDKVAIAGEEEEQNSCPLRRLGQFSDWSEPVNLGPIVNSEFDDTHPAISANGRSLYISSTRPVGSFGAADIWVSQRASVNDPWGPPQNLGPNINTPYNDAAPNLSFDGHWLYFHSNRPGGCGIADLYVSYREDTDDDFGWEPAVDLGCAINSHRPYFSNGPTYFKDDETGTVTMYFNGNRPEGIGIANIYVSTQGHDGTFGPAVLVPELSSPKMDGRTAIRRDGLEMLISSNRSGSIGSNDIWVSTRASTSDAWSTPVHLGPQINSGFFDGGSALSCDGSTLYFTSSRPGGLGGRDLYVSTRTEVCDDQDDREGRGRRGCKHEDD